MAATETWNDPAVPIVTGAPLAVQVSTLEATLQLILALLVMLVKPPVVTLP